MRKKHLALTLGFILATVGLILPYWIFLVIGLLLCSLMYPWLAIIIGAVADIVFGMPTGILHYVPVPFTFLGIASALLSMFASSRFRSRTLY